MALRPPPIARDRLARLAAAGGAGRSGPGQIGVAAGAGGFAELQRLGFRPVGEVMGCVASNLATHFEGSCGYRSTSRSLHYSGDTGRPPLRLASGQQGLTASFPRRAEAAYATAIDRLRDEVAARGADGVVGIEVSTRHLEGNLTEVVLFGHAVRADSFARPKRPFLTSLPATDVARLLLAGWVPVDLHVAVELGLRHDDSFREVADEQTGTARQWGRNNNYEIEGYSALKNRVRASVRDRLAARARGANADGVAVGHIRTHSHHRECIMRGGSDRVVAGTAWGTSFARYVPPTARTGPSASILTSMMTLPMRTPTRTELHRG